jgi:non-heme Fe2+,alpha-ketoglutarate-dependent halogenase
MHSDLLLHGSDANLSDRRRAGITPRHTGASVRLIDGYDFWRNSTVHIMKRDINEFWYSRTL